MNFFYVEICFKGIAFLLMSCHVHVSFIAVNIRNNLQPSQHHWYDVYLMKTHIPLHILSMSIKAIILSFFPEAKVRLENCTYTTHHPELGVGRALHSCLPLGGKKGSLDLK